MKKNTIKAFTLVEMLIVIVIIGILIASLMPRMQTAQGRARDVARKNDLSQIQTAIITSQSDRKVWPGMPKSGEELDDDDPNPNDGIVVDKIAELLKQAWMTAVPTDPNGSNVTYWLGTTDTSTTPWQYIYMVGKRNWIENAWFALMAKTEVEWSSNWVVCDSDDSDDDDTNWVLESDDDLSTIQLCENVEKATGDDAACSNSDGTCTFTESGQLRYLLVY